MAIYLQIGDKSKRGWIKKMYKNISNVPSRHESQINLLYKDRVSDTIDLRNQLEHITGDVKDNLSRY